MRDEDLLMLAMIVGSVFGSGFFFILVLDLLLGGRGGPVGPPVPRIMLIPPGVYHPKMPTRLPDGPAPPPPPAGRRMI